MHEPKVTANKFIRYVETGEGDEYLAAHSESAAVYAPGRKNPRYDVLLDAEASNDLFRSLNGGHGDLQTASQEELLAFVNAAANNYDSHFNHNSWKAALKRCVIAVVGITILCAVMFLTMVLTSK